MCGLVADGVLGIHETDEGCEAVILPMPWMHSKPGMRSASSEEAACDTRYLFLHRHKALLDS